MTPFRTFRLAAPILALAALVACGGGGGGSTPPAPATASSLAYTDPTSGTYLLKKNTTLSSGAHLVLDLVGPATGTSSGVSLTLNADTTRLTWTKVAASDPANALVQNGTQFNLGTGTPILLARASGTALQATVAQKGTASPASLNGPLLRVALDLKSGLNLAQGTALTLSADNTKCQAIDGTGAVSAITVSVGTLTAQ